MPTATADPRSPHWTRSQARLVVTALLLASIWSLFALYWPRSSASPAHVEGGKDLAAYRRIIECVHDGEDYYSAAGDELRRGGYATSSVFNWRLPAYAWLLAVFPQPEWGQALLTLLALVALALAYAADRADGSVGRSLVLLVTMLGAFLWCIDGDAFLSQELWAGVLIAVSVGAFAVGQRAGGVAAGLAALLMRELALPYVLVALFLACRERRWREVTAWGLGLVGYAFFLAWHAWQVQQHLTGDELAEADGWIQLGGPAFVIHTSQMNAWLFKLPAWVGLLYLLASFLGLAWWRGPVAARVKFTVALYVLAFLIVGKPFNGYWGLLYVALLPFGLIRVVPAACELLKARGAALAARV